MLLPIFARILELPLIAFILFVARERSITLATSAGIVGSSLADGDTLLLLAQRCRVASVRALSVEQGWLFLPGSAYDRVDHTSFGRARLPANARMPRPRALSLVLSTSVPMA